MHIPDGILNNSVCMATSAAALLGVGAAATQVLRTRQEVPAWKIAAVGGGIFAAQMVNFPVAHGTSGHLIGAALATALLGPSLALLSIALVLTVQCVVFGDGGIYALGANVFNMAVLGVGISQLVLWATRRPTHGPAAPLASAAAAWLSVMAATFACSIELALSGTQPLAVVLSAMAKIHAMIGIGEAFITAVVVALIGSAKHFQVPRPAAIALATGVLVAGTIAPWASTSPDGLEAVAEQLGFAGNAVVVVAAPLPEYSISAALPEGLSTAIAGVVGTLMVIASAWLLTRPLQRVEKLTP